MSEDLESWLDACGLSKYLPAFEENEVSIADLQYLTDDDLKEIGLPIGPRRRLLARISEGVPPEPVAAEVEEAASPRPSETSGPERRQLTVLFSDWPAPIEWPGYDANALSALRPSGSGGVA